MYKSLMLLLFVALFSSACKLKPYNQYDNWEVYGGTKDKLHYSTLRQVDTTNVAKLQVAWIHHTGDADTSASSQIQCNPIIVDGTLYATTPTLKLIALDPATGKQKWVFDPAGNQNKTKANFGMNNNRGVAYWQDGDDKRILFCAGSSLYAVNALTGKLIPNFGLNGAVDLHNGLERDVSKAYVTSTTPGMVYKDLYILGTRVNETADAAPGHIRAYDIRTGKQKWIFHTIPKPGEADYNTWEDRDAWKHIGSANSWSGFSLDEKRGMLFAPTGSAAYDFYGGKRLGANLFANCVLTLNAETGKLIWHYQVVHHDLWDKDLPTAPVLLTIKKDGKNTDVVAQPTKHGFIFVLDRETGKPIFKVDEKPVPTNTELAGEKVWPTQPFPQLPQPFTRQLFGLKDINPYLRAEEKAEVLEKLKGYQYGNMFIPPSKKPIVLLPGFDGGAEWGGPAADPQTDIMYINANEMAWIFEMKETEKQTSAHETYAVAGSRLFANNCSGCHGADRRGTGNYPSLVGIGKKYNDSQIQQLLQNGRRMMPSFKQLDTQEKAAIISFITANTKTEKTAFIAKHGTTDPYLDIPYQSTGYNKFLTKNGTPALAPPWGTLNAVNLSTGIIAWRIPLGNDTAFAKKGEPDTGTENYGGPVVTAGGLVFIAATKDAKIRAFNKANGKLLWEAKLPAAGFATPSLYAINGKQYLVIACGGGKLKTKSGDAYVAFALPN